MDYMQGKIIQLICLFFFISTAQSGSISEITASNFYKNFEVSAAGGPNWFNTHNTHLIISPYETDSNNQITNISNNGAWKVGVGYYFDNQWSQYPFLNSVLFEVNVYGISATVHGSVDQYELAQFNNYSFAAQTNSTRVMFDFKSNLYTWRQTSFYPILGVGTTWDTTSYKETAIQTDISQDSALILGNHTNSQIAWDVGVGINIAYFQYLHITAEYVYAFLGYGSAAQSSANDVLLSTPPSFSYQTQSLLFGISLNFK